MNEPPMSWPGILMAFAAILVPLLLTLMVFR